MKFLTLIFAVLAIVPQAIKGMAWGLARMNDCTPGAGKCLVNGEERGELIAMLYSNWATNTGLWLGCAGLAACVVISTVRNKIEARKSQRVMDEADRRAGIGRPTGRASGHAPRKREYGAMPRPGYLDRFDNRRS